MNFGPTLRIGVSMLLLVSTALSCTSKRKSNASTTKTLTTAADDAKLPSRKKIFFGFREVLSNSEMNNETRADNEHVVTIAKDANGGGYITNPAFEKGYLETREGGGQRIGAEYNRILSSIGPGDMYLQMSAGHGYEGGVNGGLAVGATHQDIADQAFAMLDRGASEVVIFMMACFSGGLVEAFQQDPRLRKYGKDKTIFVMASSRSGETSSTLSAAGDGKLGGQAGTAGSAFGNALWRAMRGDADQAQNGGNDDGIVTLGEIAAFATALTKDQGNHTPTVLQGHYDATLPIVCIPDHPKARSNPLCRPASAGSAIGAGSSTPTGSQNPGYIGSQGGSQGGSQAGSQGSDDGSMGGGSRGQEDIIFYP